MNTYSIKDEQISEWIYEAEIWKNISKLVEVIGEGSDRNTNK